MFLHTLLLVLTDLAAGLLGTSLFRRHFHLLLSAALLLGPALSLWVSPHSVFAKRSHFLYRLFLGSGWGWTSLFAGSFLFSFSFSVGRSLPLSLRHLSRLGVSGGLWLGFCRLLDLLENSTGSCYEPLQEAPGGPGLLVLREGQTRGGCGGGGLVWRGYEVSEDVFLLCLCCLLLVEETAVLGPFLSGGGAADGPLRLLFLLSVLLLGLWLFLLLCLLAYFPQFPAQLLGGALGCLSWRGLYRGWFRMGPSWFCPGRPGQGLLHAKPRGTQAEEPLNHNHN
ncbi:LOW QUALITY PROTEIN: fat storage-inducing transmembrane protein 1-like [Menidia menidia]